jgi:tRNA-dihydrouridine synthase B
MSALAELKIGTLSIYPPIVLAPLAGFTDSPFRRIVKEFAAGLVYTEMISSVGLFFKDEKTLCLTKYNAAERPICAQIFGSEADKLSYAAAFLQDKGFDAVDINMGCPTPKILKSNSGGTLLKDLNLVKQILKRVRKVLNIPLTIKARKGFFKGENILRELIEIAQGEGVDAVAIHGIAVEEGFLKSSENWESIRKAKEISKIPIIGNGGIQSEEDVKKMFESTGVDGVMVGRSVLIKPWFIKSSKNFIEIGSIFSLSINEKLNIIIKHIKLEVEEKGELKGVKEMRKFIHGYVYGMRGAMQFRNKLNSIESSEELIALVEGFFGAKEEI